MKTRQKKKEVIWIKVVKLNETKNLRINLVSTSDVLYNPKIVGIKYKKDEYRTQRSVTIQAWEE